jgi:hypothetical protein
VGGQIVVDTGGPYLGDLVRVCDGPPSTGSYYPDRPVNISSPGCSYDLPLGTSVALTAQGVPAAGGYVASHFVAWNLDCAGAGSFCNLGTVTLPPNQVNIVESASFAPD